MTVQTKTLATIEQTQTTTAEELLRMPDDGFRSELIRGTLRKMAPAGCEPGKISINISTPLDMYVRTYQLGTVYAAETGFLLATDPDHVRVPDVAFVSHEQQERVGPVQGYWPGPPDLAIEVVSPYDSPPDVARKGGEWLQAGGGW